MLALTPKEPPIELADRGGDGFVVTLHWNRDGDGRLWVSVLHEDTGETFVVEARVTTPSTSITTRLSTACCRPHRTLRG
jgi:hypothetical protein